jgi:hypothetical protein
MASAQPWVVQAHQHVGQQIAGQDRCSCNHYHTHEQRNVAAFDGIDAELTYSRPA